MLRQLKELLRALGLETKKSRPNDPTGKTFVTPTSGRFEDLLESMDQMVNQSGRVSSEYLIELARAKDVKNFVRYVGRPVLAGSGIREGTLVQPGQVAVGTKPNRKRAVTLIFKPAEIIASAKRAAEAEPLQRALYPLLKGPDSNTKDPMVFNIGREPENDIVIPDFSISKTHALIRVGDRRYTLIDCSSANGTKVNGVAVEPGGFQLSDRDVITLARYEFSFLTPETLYRTLTK